MKNLAIRNCADLRKAAPPKQRLHVPSSAQLIGLGTEWTAHLTQALRSGKANMSPQQTTISDLISSELLQTKAMGSDKKLEQTQPTKSLESRLKMSNQNSGNVKQVASASARKPAETSQPISGRQDTPALPRLPKMESREHTGDFHRTEVTPRNPIETAERVVARSTTSKMSGELKIPIGTSSSSGKELSKSELSLSPRSESLLPEVGRSTVEIHSRHEAVLHLERDLQKTPIEQTANRTPETHAPGRSTDRLMQERFNKAGIVRSALTRNTGAESRPDSESSGAAAQRVPIGVREETRENRMQNPASEYPREKLLKKVSADLPQKGSGVKANLDAKPGSGGKLMSGRAATAPVASDAASALSSRAKENRTEKLISDPQAEATKYPLLSSRDVLKSQTVSASSRLNNSYDLTNPSANRTGSNLFARRPLEMRSQIASIQRRITSSTEVGSKSQTPVKNRFLSENHQTTAASQTTSSQHFKKQLGENFERAARGGYDDSRARMLDVKTEMSETVISDDRRPLSLHAASKTLSPQSGFATAVTADASTKEQRKALKSRNEPEPSKSGALSELKTGAKSSSDLRLPKDTLSPANSQKRATQVTAKEETTSIMQQNSSMEDSSPKIGLPAKMDRASGDISDREGTVAEPSREKTGKEETLSGTSSSQLADRVTSQEFNAGAVNSRAPYLSLKVEQLKELRALLEQVMRTSQLVQLEDGNDIRFLWASKEWGPVRFAIRQQEQEIVAKVEVNQPEVRALLETHREALQQIFSDQGLHLDRLDIESPSQYDNMFARDVKWDEPRRYREQARDFLDADTPTVEESLALEPSSQEREATGRVWIA